MDTAGGAYLPPKSLPEGGWMRQAGLIFRRRACRREDGYGLRGLSSAEELAGERMDALGGTYLPPKNLPRREANDETAELPLSPSPCKTRFNSFS